MNTLELAVAGGRKTQRVVDACAAAPAGRRILVLTFTTANQRELRTRLAMSAPLDAEVVVQGWFTFLLGEWVRPYLPLAFPGRRLRGFNYEGDPPMMASGRARYLDSEDRAYGRHLARLATLCSQQSGGAVLDRLSRIYDEIYIDEVQDLNGYDLEVLLELLDSSIDLTLVGDVRQAILQTNYREPKHKQYKGVAIRSWFEIQRGAGRLMIKHASTTWRCNQPIADFADSIFDSSWGFNPTTSAAGEEDTGHDGVFAVHSDHVHEYVARFQPLCLRYSAGSGKAYPLPYTTFGMAKGQAANRVLIAPTKPIERFLTAKEMLAGDSACGLYVAVTRARHSVAFIGDYGGETGLAQWTPPAHP